MDKLVLAVTDGSAAGQGALGWAAVLCAATHSRLSVATAWQPEFSEMDPPTYAEHLEAARRGLEDDWCATLRASGAAFEAVLLEGDPRQVIPGWAAEHEADLVVLGPHGRGRDHRHGGYVGSVTTFLAHNLGRPLVSVPLGASADAPERIVVGVDGSPPSLQALQWCADWAPALGAEVSVVFAERPFGKVAPRTDPNSWYQRALHSLEEWSAPLRARQECPSIPASSSNRLATRWASSLPAPRPTCWSWAHAATVASATCCSAARRSGCSTTATSRSCSSRPAPERAHRNMHVASPSAPPSDRSGRDVEDRRGHPSPSVSSPSPAM